MRTLKITEIDSACYRIETTGFSDSDAVVYSWDQTSQRFEGEYQRATPEKRKFQSVDFSFRDHPTFGQAIDFIMKHDRHISEGRWSAMIAERRTRQPDRITV